MVIETLFESIDPKTPERGTSMRTACMPAKLGPRFAWLWGFSACVLLLAACGASSQSAGEAQPTTHPVAPATAAPASTEPISPTALPTAVRAADDWQTYRSAQAGYRVDYPAGWMASERSEADGRRVTTFQPVAGGVGITVIAQPGGTAADNADLPNTRCQPVSVGGLSGTRCFDTIAMTTTTILMSQNTTFLIVAPGRRLDQQIYQRFLESFRPISA
jgi:hypothetical protein